MINIQEVVLDHLEDHLEALDVILNVSEDITEAAEHTTNPVFKITQINIEINGDVIITITEGEVIIIIVTITVMIIVMIEVEDEVDLPRVVI